MVQVGLYVITHSPADSKFCFSSFFIRGRPGFIFKGEVGVFWAAGWMKWAKSSVCFNRYSNLFALSVCWWQGKINWNKCETFQYAFIQKKKQTSIFLNTDLHYFIHITTTPKKRWVTSIYLLLTDSILFFGAKAHLCYAERSKLWDRPVPRLKSDFATKIAQVSLDKARVPLTTSSYQNW